MEKLTIQHIAPYLPYGLQVDASYYDEEKPQNVIGYHDTFGVICSDGLISGGSHGKLIQSEYAIEYVKPILYPISCLTKTIQHEGSEFIPLIELAKIAYNSDWFYKEGSYNVVTSAETHGFDWNEDHFEMYSQISGGYLPVKNQYQLFQKLAEWHINFVGIPEGLYIDKNTLK